MRITVDTNILVSSTFWNGPSNKIIEKAEKKEIELVLSEEIIQEFVNVLNYKEIQDKIRNKGLDMNRTAEKIVAISEIVDLKIKLKIVKEDPNDDKFFEWAKTGNVNYIVSKDNHLLKLKEFEGIKIIKPEEFLKILE